MNRMYGINEELLLPDTVAVVGSSPSLTSKNLGRLIDDFDIVIRFNGAVTKGFEETVGSRTDIICLGLDLAYFSNYPFVGPSGDVTKLESKNRLQNALILKALNDSSLFITWEHEEERAEKNKQHENLQHLSEYVDRSKIFTWATEKAPNEVKDNYQGNRILKEYEIPVQLHPSKGMRTGFRILLMLIKSGIRPSIFGFDIDQEIKSARHYYDNFISDNFDEHTAHDFRGEMAALLELRNKNLIEIKG